MARSPSQAGPPSVPPTPVTGKARKGLPRGAKLAIIAGCVTVIIILVVVVLLSFSFVEIFKKPVDVANAYIKASSSGDLETAWSYLSAGTKTKKGKATFESDVRDLEGQIKTWNTRGVQIINNRAQITMDVEFKNGEQGTLYVYLVKEAGKWKVRSAAETPFSGFKK
jgi:hypothetical protein